MTAVPVPKPAKGSDKPVSTSTAKKNPFAEVKPEDCVVKPEDWGHLEEALFKISSPNGLSMDFLGAMLQTIQIDFTFRVGTACISFVPQKKQYLIELNPVFFRLMTREERMSILLHELEHMTSLHLVRIPAFENRQKANVCADATINTKIPGIPTRQPIRGIFPQDFGLPNDKSMEDYYDLWPEPEGDEGEGDGEGDGGNSQGGSSGESEEGEGDGEGEDPNGSGGGKNEGNGKGKRGKLLDEHDWDGTNDESDMLEGVEDVIKRTMVKTSRSYDKLPGQFKDLLEHIDKRRKAIDWRKQIKQFTKRTTSGVDKEPTRTRPNKRYDYLSPGLKMGDYPKLLILEDTSGSMSIIEVNAGLDQVDEILRVGARKVSMGFWHTGLYHVQKYKRGNRSDVHKKLQSGGTCFEECAKYINKLRPDAVIVFTDGYFSDTKTKVHCPILFVISHGGAPQLPTTYPLQRQVKLPNMGET